MQLLHTCAELRRWCVSSRPRQRPIHFVPTMGALHRGHQALIEQAARPRGAKRPLVLVSVFVNPLQFGAGEDLSRYPSSLAEDLELARRSGADAVVVPTPEDLFPGGELQLTRVLPPQQLQQRLCGRHRPGHFDGVATVVARFLGLIQPDRLLLGEKDWQQLVILRRLVADFGLPLVVEGIATVRESDGLACSSRNSYLSEAERARAGALPRALGAAQGWVQGGQLEVSWLEEKLRASLECAGLEVEYVELVRPHDLTPLARLEGLGLLATAVRCGTCRLIDHAVLMRRAPIVAIDGPAGAGKSTVTRAFARELGLIYLDTGAMYRALTWWVLHRGVNPSEAGEVEPLLEGLDLQLGSSPEGEQWVRINGQDVTEAIRSPEVTARVSAVSAHGCVREALTRQQQAMGQRGGLVAEGRDIGTAVFPNAELKVFLTATVAERARRRALDLKQRGFAVPERAELEALIAERDYLDSSRAVAPLRQAEDAQELVTDGMAIEAVIAELVQLFRERVPHEAWPIRPLG